MARRKYVALATVDYKDENGDRKWATPKGRDSTGIFSADLTEAQEKRLIDAQAIRRATNKDLAADTEADDEVSVETPADDADDGTGGLTVEKTDAGYVVKRDDAVVSTEPFKTKKDAVAWAEANPEAQAPAGEEDLLG